MPAHYKVKHVTFYEHRTQTEHNLLATYRERTERVYGKTAADDDKVYHDKSLAERYVVVLVYYSRNDVCTSCTTVAEEYYSECRTGEHTSYDKRHEVVTLSHKLIECAVGHLHNLLCQVEHYGNCNGGIDGFGKELQSEFL